MAERKSKPKNTHKDDDDLEGFEALKQNPWFILGMIIVFIAVLVTAVILLSRFLSGNVSLDEVQSAAMALLGLPAA